VCSAPTKHPKSSAHCAGSSIEQQLPLPLGRQACRMRMMHNKRRRQQQQNVIHKQLRRHGKEQEAQLRTHTRCGWSRDHAHTVDLRPQLKCKRQFCSSASPHTLSCQCGSWKVSVLLPHTLPHSLQLQYTQSTRPKFPRTDTRNLVTCLHTTCSKQLHTGGNRPFPKSLFLPATGGPVTATDGGRTNCQRAIPWHCVPHSKRT
jgi:hypothetical protein